MHHLQNGALWCIRLMNCEIWDGSMYHAYVEKCITDPRLFRLCSQSISQMMYAQRTDRIWIHGLVLLRGLCNCRLSDYQVHISYMALVPSKEVFPWAGISLYCSELLMAQNNYRKKYDFIRNVKSLLCWFFAYHCSVFGYPHGDDKV